MGLGIERREIFKDDKDRKSFLIRRQNPLLAKQPNKLNGPDKPNKPEKALAEKTIEDETFEKLAKNCHFRRAEDVHAIFRWGEAYFTGGMQGF